MAAMGHATADGALTPRPPADPALALLLADLLAYQTNLRSRGDLLQARAVARCIELLRQRARRGPPN